MLVDIEQGYAYTHAKIVSGAALTLLQIWSGQDPSLRSDPLTNRRVVRFQLTIAVFCIADA